MSPNPPLAVRATVLMALLMASTAVFSAEGSTTFESFYHQASGISWWFAGIAAALLGILVLVGAPVLVGLSASVVASIGSSVGGLFGLSGVAATNAGLALLGGGSIATGGFGVIGGTALLAAALSFGSDITLDYAAGSIMSKYESGKFAEASLKMMTLPLPVNTAGPASVRAAGKALKSTVIRDSWGCAKQFPKSFESFNRCLVSQQRPQRQLIQDALAAMGAKKTKTSGSDAGREAAMSALLHFLNNDYVAAKSAAYQSYELEMKLNGKPTLPAFIYASSLLYDDSPDLTESWAKFQFAISAESKNPLTPVLFSAYLDRLSYRLNDGAVGINQLDRIGQFSASLADDERKLAIQQTILSQELMQLKVAQQRVLSLTGSQNASIRGNPKTRVVVNSSLRDYRQLVKLADDLVVRQTALLGVLSRDDPWWDEIKGGKNPLKKSSDHIAKQGWPDALKEYKTALEGYGRSQKMLGDRVASFEKQLAGARGAQQPDTAQKQ